MFILCRWTKKKKYIQPKKNKCSHVKAKFTYFVKQNNLDSVIWKNCNDSVSNCDMALYKFYRDTC